ncbi:hypothetical protein ABTX35_17950, partial [Streptomyces sp. NPDC096080]|uniref:hypothetical protein n=1 Tax=Streptomyces sp. NPDC096080 TaxID=3156693 RepID=UPI0033292FF7
MGDTAEAVGAAGERVPTRLAAVFLPALLPRDGLIAFWDPEDGPLPAEDTQLTVVRPHPEQAHSERVDGSGALALL